MTTYTRSFARVCGGAGGSTADLRLYIVSKLQDDFFSLLFCLVPISNDTDTETDDGDAEMRMRDPGIASAKYQSD